VYGTTLSKLLEVEDTPAHLTSTQPLAKDDKLLLHNSHQFYKWHSELEAAMGRETEQKYRHYAGSLEGHLQTCDRILSQVNNNLNLFFVNLTCMAEHNRFRAE
jgi:hypothetical protein